MSYPDSRRQRTKPGKGTWLLIALLSWCPLVMGFDDSALQSLLETTRTEMKMPGLRAAVRLKDGRIKFDPSSEWTGGGLITNPTMLVQFYGALVNDQIVSQESLAQMIAGGWRLQHQARHPGDRSKFLKRQFKPVPVA